MLCLFAAIFRHRGNPAPAMGVLRRPNQGGKDEKMINMAGAQVVGGAIAINGGVGFVEFYSPRTQAAEQVQAAINGAAEAVKEYSAEVLKNAHITLRELKEKVQSTGKVKLPSFKQLMEKEPTLVAHHEVGGAKLDVYENGFATYEQDEAHTVLAVDRCGGYRYEFSDGSEYIPAELFEETEWPVRLVMEGEKRLEANRARNQARRETGLDDYENTDLSGLTMVDFMEEENMRLLADREMRRLYTALRKLTERQFQIVQLYFFKEMTQEEIAEELEISQRAVSYSLEGAIKKMKKVF